MIILLTSRERQFLERALRESAVGLPSGVNDGKQYSYNSMQGQDLDILRTNQTGHSLWDTDLVYDPSSYIPRSARIQLSVQAFGHLVNLANFGMDLRGKRFAYLVPNKSKTIVNFFLKKKFRGRPFDNQGGARDFLEKNILP